MILAPSEIHFLRDASEEGLLTPDETTLAALSSRFSEGDEQIPKVQVTEKDGSWFALNNSYLHIVKDLEKKGKCARIRVEVVPLTKVPKTLQKGMVCEPCCRNVGQSDCRLSHNYHAADHEVDADTDDTSSYTSSDYSDYDDGDDDDDISDSEYDDDLTCNVCDRSFGSTRLLSQHQQRKRHFGCSVCDSCFPSLHGLEIHKESLEHWSDDDGNTYESDDDHSDNETRRETKTAKAEDNVQGLEKKPEEVERLL